MKKYKIGITLGDINGVGPEVILKTLTNERLMERCIPIIYGSGKVLGYHKNIVKNNTLSFVTCSNPKSAAENKINVINCVHDTVNINLGKATQDSGRFAYVCLDAATDDLASGMIDGLVTGPINKNAMQMADFPEKGHTEYIAKKVGDEEPLMFMVSDEIKIAVATAHIPLGAVAATITKELIIEKVRAIETSLIKDFGIEKPMIAVMGLNPHAGDEGAIGAEENEIIRPALIELKKSGLMVAGPYGADGFFGKGLFKKFHAVLAMYHDQGLIPFKTLSFGHGVNYTAGLGVIRTSPDHGTAYDIVGQNLADEASFRTALNLAIDIIEKRSAYNDLKKNRLKKQRMPEMNG